MVNNRIIPALLLMGNRLVKTKKFKDPIYVGDPINVVRIFNDKEVDEIIVLDILASKYSQDPNYATIEKLASECFMPLTYGGGIRTLDQASRLFSIGIEKISIQTSAHENLEIVKQISDKFGSQSIVVSIDVERNFLGFPKLRKGSSRISSKTHWLEYAKKAVSAGAGEILVNAVDKDGTLSGPDLNLIHVAANDLSVPLIYMGGIASLMDIKACFDLGASAVAAGAFFVFNGPYKAVLISYPNAQDIKQAVTVQRKIS